MALAMVSFAYKKAARRTDLDPKRHGPDVGVLLQKPRRITS